mgnify:FL=1
MAKELFGETPDPSFTAIFASTDSNTPGLLEAADECGIRIPEDISLLGFDNIPYSGPSKIVLSTIEHPYKLMAESAVEILIDQISQPEAGYSHKVLMPKLVIRNSCRRIEGK